MALAQDDLDSLMEADRELDPGERHESADDEDEEELDEDEDLDQMGDDEAPPEGWQGETVKKKKEPEEDEAEDPAETALSVAVLVGYGVSLEDVNPWGFGFGLRAGYNIDAFFVGGRFVFYIGETVTETRASFSGGTSEEDISHNLWELGAEVGYDIAIDAVTLRPGLGLGLASGSSGGSSEVNVYVAPGLSLLYGVSDSMYLGLDARFQAILSEFGANGIPILATVGMSF